MQRYKVIVLPEARRDRDRIIESLRSLSDDVAKNYRLIFAAELQSLSELPNRCPPARDSVLAERGYRYLAVKHYLVFFTVAEEDKTVTIRSIIDGRSDYLSI